MGHVGHSLESFQTLKENCNAAMEDVLHETIHYLLVLLI